MSGRLKNDEDDYLDLDSVDEELDAIEGEEEGVACEIEDSDERLAFVELGSRPRPSVRFKRWREGLRLPAVVGLGVFLLAAGIGIALLLEGQGAPGHDERQAQSVTQEEVATVRSPSRTVTVPAVTRVRQVRASKHRHRHRKKRHEKSAHDEQQVATTSPAPKAVPVAPAPTVAAGGGAEEFSAEQ